MKRQLTARERILLGLLAVVALVSGYILLFYTPMTAERDDALAETQLCLAQLEAARSRAAEKQRMERELKELFAQNRHPVSLAPYDNVQPVMVELHAILSAAEDYSLTFSTVNAEKSIVRRSIALNFTSGSYERTKSILRQLRNSEYRCMLENVAISIGRGAGRAVSVDAVIVFFEYQ